MTAVMVMAIRTAARMTKDLFWEALVPERGATMGGAQHGFCYDLDQSPVHIGSYIYTPKPYNINTCLRARACERRCKSRPYPTQLTWKGDKVVARSIQCARGR